MLHKAHVRSIAAGALALAAIVGLSTYAAYSHRVEAATSVSSGDLIRGESFSAVYYMGADGFRYVFPNEKTYFTWYSDFSTVKFLTDAQLAEIQIGGNVTYKPGVKMIKINTDPKVYAVGEDGALYSIASESAASTLYGSSWNRQIDDMPDAFFSNYTITGETTDAVGFDPEATEAGVTTINNDKSLVAPAEISITDDGFDPISVDIEAGQTVRFTNDGDENHTATGDSGRWGTGTLEPGDTFVSRFTTEGTYTFTDGYDEVNTGAVFVE